MKQKKAYVFLADGFEETEALVPVDVMRRGGIDVTTVSITGSLTAEGAHGVSVIADEEFDDVFSFEDADLLMLPGGMPGAENLRSHEPLARLLTEHARRGGMLAAICAAPMVLGELGLLRGRRATCYPGFESRLEGADYTAELVTPDLNITTGCGPAAAFPFAFSLLAQLAGDETADEIAKGMRF